MHTRARDLVAVALLALAALVVGLSALRFAYDDAWITYRYAYNLATGEGLVYNLGERFLGTTAPGYAVLLAALGSISPDSIPLLSGLICIVALAAAGIGLYAFGRVSDRWLGGLVAGGLFIVNPIAVETFGGEMMLQAALAIWAVVAQRTGRPMLAVVLACAATIVRPDGLLVLAIVGALQTWTTRKLPWRQMVVAAVLLAAWFGALWIYFGAPLPETLGAKAAQRVSGLWRPLVPDLIAWFGSFSAYGPTIFGSRPAAGFTTLLHLAALGVPALVWRRHWWPLLIWPVTFLLAYRVLDMPFYHWYALPPLVAVVVSAAAAVEAVSAGLGLALSRASGQRETPTRAAGALPWAVSAAVLGVVAVPIGRFTVTVGRNAPHEVERAYANIGRWLARETPPSASVGYVEIGIVGYYARRTIIDPLGLVNPGVAAHVAERDFRYAYRTYNPDVIIHNPVFPVPIGIDPQEAWLPAEYKAVATLDSGLPEPVTIYRRRPQPSR